MGCFFHWLAALQTGAWVGAGAGGGEAPVLRMESKAVDDRFAEDHLAKACPKNAEVSTYEPQGAWNGSLREAGGGCRGGNYCFAREIRRRSRQWFRYSSIGRLSRRWPKRPRLVG
jgi:hypothetical protein